MCQIPLESELQNTEDLENLVFSEKFLHSKIDEDKCRVITLGHSCPDFCQGHFKQLLNPGCFSQSVLLFHLCYRAMCRAAERADLDYES